MVSFRQDSRRDVLCTGAAFLGLLPLLPIARGIGARLGALPQLPGAELAAGDVKLATYAEAVSFVIALPLAAFALAKTPADRTARLQPFRWAPLGWLSSFAAWHVGTRPKWCLLIGGATYLLLRRAPIERERRFFGRVLLGGASRLRPLLPWVLSLLLGAVGWRIYWRPAGPFDYFEDGQSLANAQSYLSGGLPYRDAYPLHGWGSDGGVAAWAFRRFGPTLGVYRAQRAALQAGAFVSLLLLCGAVFRRRVAWTVLSALLCLSICPFVSDRQALFFLCAFFLAMAIGGAHAGVWYALAGAAAGAEILYSLDLGLFALAASVLGIALVTLVDRPVTLQRALAGWSRLAFGLAVAIFPLLLNLARHGSLGLFLTVSFREIPRMITDAWGLPVPALGAAVGGRIDEGALLRILGSGPIPSLFVLAVLGASVIVLATVANVGALTVVDRKVMVVMLFLMAGIRGMLGRADAGHVNLYGALVGIPSAWLLKRSLTAGERMRPLLVCASALLVLSRLHPFESAELQVAMATHRCPEGPMVSIPRGGRARVPQQQAGELAALANTIGNASFFDFSNSPSLYFLLNRTMPTRFSTAELFEDSEKQREVISALLASNPEKVILENVDYGTYDGISNAARTPLVDEFLRRRYSKVENVGRWKVARRSSL